MNYEENLTYEWLNSLRQKLIKEEDTTTSPTNQCPQEYPRAASQNSRYASLYGDFCYKGTDAGSIDINPEWISQNITSITLNGKSYQINKYIADHFVKTYEAAANKSGYRPQISGIYNPRHVEGGGLSAHAWGMAIDFEASKNPWIKDKTENLANPSVMDKNPDFIETFEANDFKWLGFNEEHKSGVGDDMHFYYSKKTSAAGPLFVGAAAGGASPQSEFNQQDFSDWKQYFRPFLSKLIPDDNPLVSVVTPVQLNEGTSGALSDDQIAKLCYDVGWRGEDLVTAVRIVMGESGGIPTQRNDGLNADGTVDRGLFQLNSRWFSHVSDEDAFNPIKNAQYAFQSYQKNGFKAWRGRTNFHSLRKDKATGQMVPDTDKIERAKNAVQRLTGYTSTGKFEYLDNVGNVGQQNADTSTKQYSDWKSYSRPFLSKLIPDDNPLASLKYDQSSLDKIIPDNPLKETKLLSEKNKFKIIDKTNDKRIEKYKKLLSSMLPYYDKRLKLTKPVKIIFVEDEKNATNPLGRTAFYAPETMTITLYTTNRFIKDILRSLGHELIHHKQHCIDEFTGMATPAGYAQKNKKLRKKEEEAYLFGNMLFRDWEDKYKSKHKKEL